MGHLRKGWLEGWKSRRCTVSQTYSHCSEQYWDIFGLDIGNECVRKISGRDGTVSTLGMQEKFPMYYSSRGIAYGFGEIFFDCNNCILKISKDGTVQKFTGKQGRYGRNDGRLSEARFSNRMGLARVRTCSLQTLATIRSGWYLFLKALWQPSLGKRRTLNCLARAALHITPKLETYSSWTIQQIVFKRWLDGNFHLHFTYHGWAELPCRVPVSRQPLPLLLELWSCHTIVSGWQKDKDQRVTSLQ